MVGETHKIIEGYSRETLLKMRICHEQIAQSQTQPKGEGLVHYHIGKNPVPSNDVVSKGDENFDLNVNEGIDPEGSVGIRFWTGRVEETHEVYGHPTGDTQFQDVYNTIGYVSYDEDSDRDVSADEWGLEINYTSDLYIPVWEHMRRGIPEPQLGDMFEFWGDSWQEFGLFFEAVEVNKNGRIHNTPHFTNWKITLERDEEFVPERRLMGASQLLCSEDKGSDANLRDPNHP